jgi:hypothetical protein
VKADATYEVIAHHESEHGQRVTEVRGSLIASSLATLRELDLFDTYLSHLPLEHHDDILYVLAASWIPVELANVHYSACDAMALTDAQLEAIGNKVSQRIVNTFLGTLLRTARVVAPPARVPLKHYPRLWDRLLKGGGCSVGMRGACDARIESHGVPMFQYRYFRIAFAGLIRGAALMFRSNVHARIRTATDDALTIEVGWD